MCAVQFPMLQNALFKTVLAIFAAAQTGASQQPAPTQNPGVTQGVAPGVTPTAPAHEFHPVPLPTLSPQVIELVKLEDRFQQDVAKGGGQAFASWFAPDGVTLNNGKPAVQGQRAIAAAANWDPKTYQLEWYVLGAQMGPSGDTGFTWGHYDAHSIGGRGQPVTSSGRYITFWKKVDGMWKVALDASALDSQ